MTPSLDSPCTPPLRLSASQTTTHALLAGDARSQVRRMQASVFVFFVVDGLLLTGYGCTGAVPWRLGWIYAAGGCIGTAALLHLFWARGGRLDDLGWMNLSQTVFAGLVMLATLASTPQVGGLMLMSMMALLSLSAIKLKIGQLLFLCWGFAAASMSILTVSGGSAGIPGNGAVERSLTGVWLACLMMKAVAHNAVGRQLRGMVAKTNAELEEALREVEKVAATDELTALPNRRSIVGQLKEALEQPQAPGGHVGVALLDIDHFKNVNDRYGHDVGDRVLCAFAGLAADSLRPGDRVGRYGGEEFLLVLRQSPDAGAAAAATERVRARVEAHDWDALAAGLAVRVSAGVVLVWPDETSSAAIQRADAALYDAKRRGRNQVVLRQALTRLG